MFWISILKVPGSVVPPPATRLPATQVSEGPRLIAAIAEHCEGDWHVEPEMSPDSEFGVGVAPR